MIEAGEAEVVPDRGIARLDQESALENDRGLFRLPGVQVLLGGLEEGEHGRVRIGRDFGALEGRYRASIEQRVERCAQQCGTKSDRLHRTFPARREPEGSSATNLSRRWTGVQGRLE